MEYSSPSGEPEGRGYAELSSGQEAAELRRQRLLAGGFVLFAVLLLAGLVYAVIYLLQPGAPTETLRDIFIIVLAVEFMIIGVALVILLVQLARLVNLLQNEVRPILDSANQAANTLRGTAAFLSRNLVGPVMKVNSAIAAVRRAADFLNPRR
jgi:hypothetical protein